MAGIESPYEDIDALSGVAPGSPLAFGGDDKRSPWKMVVIALIIILVLIVIWRFSDFRGNRLCLSTDLRDYWPDHLSYVPALPGVDYLPAVGDWIPAEEEEVKENATAGARQPWQVDDNLLSSVAAGN